MIGERFTIGAVLLTSALLVAGWASVATAAEPSVLTEPRSITPALTLSGELEACPGEEDLSTPELDLDLGTPINPTEKDAVCSPPPQCFRDRDCDAICGKRLGVCRRVNSCYSECICSVA